MLCSSSMSQKFKVSLESDNRFRIVYFQKQNSAEVHLHNHSSHHGYRQQRKLSKHIYSPGQWYGASHVNLRSSMMSCCSRIFVMNLKYRIYKTLDQKHASRKKRNWIFLFKKNEENLLKSITSYGFITCSGRHKDQVLSLIHVLYL